MARVPATVALGGVVVHSTGGADRSGRLRSVDSTWASVARPWEVAVTTTGATPPEPVVDALARIDGCEVTHDDGRVRARFRVFEPDVATGRRRAVALVHAAMPAGWAISRLEIRPIRS